MKTTKPYRLKIGFANDHSMFLTRNAAGLVQYFDGREQAHALSNLAQDKAAELRFALQDALDGNNAAGMIRRSLPGKKNRVPAES